MAKFNKDKYLEMKGSICPYCGSRSIGGAGFPQSDKNIIYTVLVCDACNEKWTSIYTLTGAIEKVC